MSEADGARTSLFAVRSELGNLEEHFAPRWADLYDDEKDDFSIEWLNAMGHMRSLEELYAAGSLPGGLHAEYLRLKARVRDLLPTIERLELPKPGVPLN